MNPFKGIALFIGWLTSSLAGIGAIMYACGYLISMAQLHLLGIDAFISYGDQRYIQEGGKFFVSVGVTVGELVLNVFIAIAILTMPVLVLIALLQWLRKDWLPSVTTRWRTGDSRIYQQRPWLYRGLAYALLIGFLFSSSEDPRVFQGPLELSNVLYESTAEVRGSASGARVHRLLISGDSATLKGYFEQCLLLELKVGLLMMLAWQVVAVWRLRIVLVAPFAVVLLLYTVFLPMLYGILMQPLRFPVVTIIPGNAGALSTDAPIYLLDKSDQEFILWDQKRKLTVWIPSTEIKSVQIHRIGQLFGPRTSGQ